MGFISNFFDNAADKFGISTDAFPIPLIDISPKELLVEQDPASLPFLSPLCEVTSINTDICSYVIKESSESKTGEDYEIYTKDTDKHFMHIRGTLLSRIPGFDEIKCCSYIAGLDGDEMTQVAKLKRKSEAIVLYRDTKKMFDSKKICWVVNEPRGEDSFVLYADEERASLMYTIQGNILQRDVHMKNAKGEIVAIINNLTSGEGNVESYEVRIAKGMDAVFVLCCVCAVDEEVDEQRETKQKE